MLAVEPRENIRLVYELVNVTVRRYSHLGRHPTKRGEHNQADQAGGGTQPTPTIATTTAAATAITAAVVAGGGHEDSEEDYYFGSNGGSTGYQESSSGYYRSKAPPASTTSGAGVSRSSTAQSSQSQASDDPVYEYDIVPTQRASLPVPGSGQPDTVASGGGSTANNNGTDRHGVGNSDSTASIFSQAVYYDGGDIGQDANAIGAGSGAHADTDAATDDDEFPYARLAQVSEDSTQASPWVTKWMSQRERADSDARDRAQSNASVGKQEAGQAYPPPLPRVERPKSSAFPYAKMAEVSVEKNDAPTSPWVEKWLQSDAPGRFSPVNPHASMLVHTRRCCVFVCRCHFSAWRVRVWVCARLNPDVCAQMLQMARSTG